MKKYILRYASTLLLMSSLSSSAAQGDSLNVKNVKLSGYFLQLSKNASLNIEANIAQQFPAAFLEIQTTIDQLPSKGKSIIINAHLKQPTISLSASEQSTLARPEAYILSISQNQIDITGSDAHGILYGLTTLENIVHQFQGLIPTGIIHDWPDHKIRALHLVARLLKPTDITHWVDKARLAKMNTLIIDLRDGVALKSLQGIALADAMSTQDFLDVIQYARESGFEVIPEIKLLTHQEHMFSKLDQSLLFNKDTYNPNNPKVYDKVFMVLDEIIHLIDPKIIHIGHDEVAGHNIISKKKWLQEGETMLPSELFLKDVLKLHAYLKSHGIRTWMWGDMLISASEFPTMLQVHLHGKSNGYGQSLRHSLPRDITICDWHYFGRHAQFPTVKALKNEGFKVLGSTWKSFELTKDFSRDASINDADGMIATTWAHVQWRDDKLVNKIINTSGKYFWNSQ